MAKDFYAVLGLSKDASPEDIKKAYRAMSKEWHPDKHKGDKAAEEKFKEINQAYEALNDPEKKKMYDRFGAAGGPGGGPNTGGFDFSNFSGGGANMGDFADIFQNFFGGGGGGGGRPQPDRGQDRETDITLDLQDVIKENRLTLSLRKLKACDLCKGQGTKEGSKLKTCDTCKGTGQVTRVAQSFFGQIQQRSVCPDCRGSGRIPEQPCDECGGEGRVNAKVELTVNVPAGIDDGQTLRINGEGDAGRRGAPAGDLYVVVRVRPDERFERDGADIRSQVSIHALDAILGMELPVETVHGKVTLSIPEGTQPGQVLRIKHKGMPVLSSSRMGDHYVEVLVDVPKKLSREERKILEEWRKAR